MNFKAILTLLVLSLLSAPALGSIGANITEELEPEVIGQLNETDVVITPAEGNFWLQMRTLWQENALWTRLAIVSGIQESEDRDVVLERLMRNYGDMAEAISPYFGNESADEYGDLIEGHLQKAIDFAAAAREKDSPTQEEVSDEWYENADETARFENSTIPKLSFIERRAMWFELINLTKNETVQVLDKDYAASIDTFDRIEEQASIMADSLAEGIIRQFPERFQ
jgi:hypothetical protein